MNIITCARINRLLYHFGGRRCRCRRRRRTVVRENVGEVRVLERRRTAIVGQIRRVRGRRQSSGKRRAPRMGETCKTTAKKNRIAD